MSRSVTLRLLLPGALLATFGCSRDPNVRKQKYFDSGEDYFAEGKYARRTSNIAMPSRSTLISPRLTTSSVKTTSNWESIPRRPETHSHRCPRSRQLRPLPISPTFWSPHRANPENNLKAANAHLDIIRDKLPNAPETHQAWATYDAAQNNIPDAIEKCGKP